MEIRTDFFTGKDCIRTMYDPIPSGAINNEGLWAILKPSALKENFRTPHFQLYKLIGGFGCRPSAGGNACFGFFTDGTKTRMERYDFIGIANEETSKYAENLFSNKD